MKPTTVSLALLALAGCVAANPVPAPFEAGVGYALPIEGHTHSPAPIPAVETKAKEMPKAVDAASKDDTKTKDKRAVAGLQHGAPGVSHAIVEEPIIELERRDDDQCMIEEEKKKVRRNNAMADDMSLSPAKDTRSLEWVGTVAPNGEVYPYYGTMKEVVSQMVKVARDAQVHHPNPISRPKPLSGRNHVTSTKRQIVCNRIDQPVSAYGETWAAYKLAGTLGALAATNASAVVAIDGGHGRCVDLTGCDDYERARIRLCNDNPRNQLIRVRTLAEYAYNIIYTCARQDGSGLIWGQQFDSCDFNVIVDACPKKGDEK